MTAIFQNGHHFVLCGISGFHKEQYSQDQIWEKGNALGIFCEKWFDKCFKVMWDCSNSNKRIVYQAWFWDIDPQIGNKMAAIFYNFCPLLRHFMLK